MRSLVDPGETFDDPGTAGQLRPAPICEAIEVTESVALGPPDQAAIVEEFVVVVEVDPVPWGRRLAEEKPALPGDRMDGKHVKQSLRAVQALDVERLSIRTPIN